MASKSPQMSAIASAAAFCAAARTRNASLSATFARLVSTLVPTNATIRDIIKITMGTTAKSAVPR